ncbi:hypothetical protein M885DRAFT_596899 [Pelagophyceae sp. CCMP2097]|nr:hypothetical protein M885DRAFT_596899 [Pelagophyceae sp. CCMP2097]
MTELVSALKSYYMSFTAWYRSTHEGLDPLKASTMPTEVLKVMKTNSKACELQKLVLSISRETVKLKGRVYLEWIDNVINRLAKVVKGINLFVSSYVPQLTNAQNHLKVLKREEGYDPSDSSGIREQLEQYSFIVPEEIKELPACKKQWPPVELEG